MSSVTREAEGSAYLKTTSLPITTASPRENSLGTTGPAACEVARRIAALFAQRAKSFGEIDPPPSLSFGVAALRMHTATSWQHLLRLADAAMYRAKRQNVVVATATGA